MSLMTRVKVTAVVITLAVAAGVVAFRDEWGRPDPSSDVNETVTVHAQFAPNRPSRPIKVTVSAEGVPLLPPNSTITHSPWDRSFQVPKGAIVTAIFDQPSSGPLSCRVDRLNRLGAPQDRSTAGVITCSG